MPFPIWLQLHLAQCRDRLVQMEQDILRNRIANERRWAEIALLDSMMK